MNMLRLDDVLKKTGLSRSSVYRLVTNGKFPKPIHLGERAVAWLDSEIDDWLTEKINERDRGIQKDE